jgi:hypothetical protein
MQSLLYGVAVLTGVGVMMMMRGHRHWSDVAGVEQQFTQLAGQSTSGRP